MTTLSPAGTNLQRLIVLRAIVLAGELAAAWIGYAYLHLHLPLGLLFLVFTLLLAVNIATWWRLHWRAPVTDIELFAHLVFDVLALTIIFYYTGGSANPFAPLYLLPLTLTAAALPGRYTWLMVALAVGCYSLLFLGPAPAAHLDDFAMHVTGMWLGFILSAGLIAYFSVKMAHTLRERDRLRAQMREQELKHERVLALGTLAAGAAHELGTPLSTMAVLVKDLSPHTATPDKLGTLRAQIERCKDILSGISAAAGETRAESARALPVDQYLEEIVRRWRALRPGATMHCDVHGPRPAPHIVAEQTLSQAVLNVLNNAADASPESVELEARWNETALILEVRDRGSGLSAAVERRIGEPFFTTKGADGMGLGLFLAHAAIERLGGSVQLYNHARGGACCRLTLPLKPLYVAA